MYELIIANKNYSSWSLRPWVLLKTLDIPFTERLFKFNLDIDTPEFRALSPSLKVPVLQDGDVTVWDSLAIVEYVAERWPAVWPADKTARAWARSAAAEMHSGFGALRDVCAMSCGVRIALTETPTALAADLQRIAALWEEGLSRFGGPYLAGAAFTAVDAFFAPVAFRLQTYGLSVGQAGDAYAMRLRDLDSMQSWYEDALREPWIDAPHDEDTLRYGVLAADLRRAAGV